LDKSKIFSCFKFEIVLGIVPVKLIFFKTNSSNSTKFPIETGIVEEAGALLPIVLSSIIKDIKLLIFPISSGSIIPLGTIFELILNLIKCVKPVNSLIAFLKSGLGSSYPLISNSVISVK